MLPDARWLTLATPAAYSGPVESDMVLLEQRLSSLIAHVRALRAANEELRRELAAAREQNRAIRERLQQAGSRLDAVIARIPGE